MGSKQMRERLQELGERVCDCGHATAQGYILCNCCLHGGCHMPPEQTLTEIHRLKMELDEC